MKDQGAFLTDFFFTSGFRITKLRNLILDTRVLETQRQSVRFSGTRREVSRARFPKGGCFPRLAPQELRSFSQHLRSTFASRIFAR
jgi:hypothetical protein